MHKQPIDLVASFLEDGMRSGASSDQVAESMAKTCSGIVAALAPIIGPRGVAALFHRSLHLTALTHGWVASVAEGDPSTVDVAALQSALAQQTSADAAACGALFLKTFNDLLMNLIGSSLTERLLRPVWATSLSGRSAQDTTA
jgi:hypothetical protein